MNENDDSNPSRLTDRLRRAAATGVAALQNRGELLVIELQEEANRVIELFIWAALACFLGIVFLALMTGVILFLLPEGYRLYAAAGFAALYLLGAVLAWLNLKDLLKSSPPPFAGTLGELEKDREWLESCE
jgi:uncharacterized membrane protein YqjE